MTIPIAKASAGSSGPPKGGPAWEPAQDLSSEAVENTAVPLIPVGKTPVPTPVPGPFLVIRPGTELLDAPAAQFLVKDLLVENSNATLYGKASLGKSFLALDLCLCIAGTHSTFLGKSVRRHGPVVYIIGEGRGRFKFRMKAWGQIHEVDVRQLPFYWTNGPVDFGKADDVKRFQADVLNLQPVLVVIDTLSRCIPGQDENSQAAMSAYVETCDVLRRRGATVMTLHHPNAIGTKARGSTVQGGAVDAEFVLKHDESGLLLENTKQRDIEEAEDIRLDLQIVPILGEYEDGEQVTSCVMRLLHEEESQSILTQIKEYLDTNPRASSNQIVKAIGVRRQTVLSIVKALRAKELPFSA